MLRRLLMFSQKDLESLAYDKWTNPSTGSTIVGDLGKLYLRYSSDSTGTYLYMYNDINQSNLTDDYLIVGICSTLGFYGSYGGGSYYQTHYIPNLKYGYVLWTAWSGDISIQFMEGVGLTPDGDNSAYTKIAHIPFSDYSIRKPVCNLSAVYAIKRLDFENYLTSTYLGGVN